jgi:hypothetical protein
MLKGAMCPGALADLSEHTTCFPFSEYAICIIWQLHSALATRHQQSEEMHVGL